MILFLLGQSVISSAQLKIKYNGLDIEEVNGSIQYCFSESNQPTDNQILQIPSTDWHNWMDKKFKLDRLSQTFLIKVPINEILKKGSFQYVSINNPHINYLNFWIIKDSKIIKAFTATGDNLVFSTRPLPLTNYDYAINGEDYQDCSLIISADKRFTNLSLPVYFYTKESYVSTNQNTNFILGIAIGITMLLLLLNLLLFALLKQQIYLWYSIFLLFTIVYLFADMGFLFKEIYPNSPQINDLIRPFSSAFSLIPLILFFNLLLQLKSKIPFLHKLNKFILLGYFPLFTIAIISSAFGSYAVQGNWLVFNKIIAPLLLVTLLAEAIYCYIKDIQYAIFAVSSYVGTSVLIIIYSLHQNELFPDNFFSARSNYWAILWELLIMSVALTWRYKYYKQESEQLALKNLDQQKKLFTETVAFQEKEMQRISSLLHDTVGANLGLLRLETDHMELSENGRKQLANQITKLGNDVRLMSHNFSPIILSDKGLYPAIEEIIHRIKSSTDVDIQFEWIGEKQQISPQNEIVVYRIVQEILQNLLKHSKAKNAFLQIMFEQNLISIYAEDDGVGFSNSEKGKGVGLKSIEKMIYLLNGQFNIKTSQQDGFSVSIEFNQYHHENN